MTNTKKNEIIETIMSLLVQLTNNEEITENKNGQSVEMLTIKECTEVVKGLKENTIRTIVAQGKIKYIRTGQGKRGKILINKADLLEYFS